MQKSHTEYDYFATGKANMVFAQFHINLMHRQCLMSSIAYDLYFGIKDTVKIDIPMDLNFDHPIEFLIIKKKDLKPKLAAMTHLNDFVKNSNTKHYKVGDENMNKNAYMIMSEHDEIAN